jgi:nitric oxide reductase subunit B
MNINIKHNIPLLFVIMALAALSMGVFFGLFASLQYIIPSFLKEIIPFNIMRPLHTTTVIAWVILAATGSIYFFVTKVEKLPLFSPNLLTLHFVIFLFSGVGIYLSFILGNTEGREYLSYNPMLMIPILIGWVLFGINFITTIRKNIVNYPVYYWMWGTGIVFMVYHLSEAHLWLFPSFREHLIKDMTVQWKAYGSFVGSWNMLVYGIAIYLMSKIKKDESVAHGKTVFFFYLLGLTNLVLGWAHHIYIIPTQVWIRYLAYAINMTEWLVLLHIIYSWKKSLSLEEKQDNSMAYKFLMAADFWIFLNIILALLFSIPAINFFTHGTHITVAHSMGTTIGINTSILFASIFYIVSTLPNPHMITIRFEQLKGHYYLYNGSLLLFFITLLYAGVIRGNWMYFTKGVHFSAMQDSLYYTYIAFALFGFSLIIAILLLVKTLLKPLLGSLKESTTNPVLVH